LRFELLEPRQLLAVDAVDDIISKNSYASNPARIHVTTNDTRTDPQIGAIITAVSPSALGARLEIVNEFGHYIVYYPPPGVVYGEDTFTYTVTDGTPGGEDTATVTVYLYDGYLEEPILAPHATVPGELATIIYRVHDLPSATSVPPTFWSTITWDDGVVTPAHVSRTVLANHDVEVFLSFWRTFSTPRAYNAAWTVFKSDSTQTDHTYPLDVQTVVQRFDSHGGTELVIGGIDNVDDRILLLHADSGVKFTLPGGESNIVNEPAMHIYYDGSDMGSFVADRVVIYGQGGDDLIQVDARITADAKLFGQAGNDILVGGAGNDILVGGIGDDILYGFNGRDLLFGGLGRDFLQGASWNGSATAADSDLLIGSYVAFDNDVTLLNQLAAQWQTGDPYSTRIATIRASSPRLRLSETVFDDWSLDYVFGAGDLDWFWVEPTRDNFDAQGDETVN
jgi:Ca2+-binding RTX toxin-like protein